jgi:hypothetical protein
MEYHVADPTGNLLFAFDLGLGGVTFDTQVFEVSDFPNAGDSSTGAFSKTYLAAQGGVKLGYNFARHARTGTPIVTIYVNGDFHWMFSKKEDTGRIAALNGVQPFGSTYTLPVTAGLRFNIP